MSFAVPGITHCEYCGERIDIETGRRCNCLDGKRIIKVNKPENKLKLIDILNKIANGELKEGTKVKWDVFEYTYKKGDCYEEYLERKVDNFDYVDILDDMYLRNLNAEVQLIEPKHLPDVGKMAEPTDNTKIEELDENKYILKGMADVVVDMFDKLNEVIRKINKEE